MQTTNALCGNCEHTWNMLEYGAAECPICGSTRIIATGGRRPAVATAGFETRIEADGLAAMTRARQAEQAALVGALKVLAFMIVLAVAVAAAWKVGIPQDGLSMRLCMLLLAAVTVTKVLVVGGSLRHLRSLVPEQTDIPLKPAQVLGHVVYEAIAICAIAGLLAIWWPVAACLVLLSGVAYAAIGAMAILSAVLLSMPFNILTLAIHAIIVAAAGYHGLHALAGLV